LNREAYTLGDLINDPQLGLELLTGGDAALATPLTGAHTIELEHPAKWLDRGWMMLTMGVRLRNKPQLQRDLIAELQELGASCLGFGVGLSFKSVPLALLDEARRRDFPVVLVPEDTQFRDVTRAVFHSTVGLESTTFQRLSSIQQNLLRAFADERPLESIIQRLGRLVHATVAVTSLDGRVDAATGTMPIAEIAGVLENQADSPLSQFDVAGWRVLAAPVSASRGPSGRWVVVACRQEMQSIGLARAAIQVTTPLVDALLRMTVTKQGQDRAIRQSLLDSLLDDNPVSMDYRVLGSRLEALGIDLNAGFHVAVIRERPSVFDPREGRLNPEEVGAWMHSQLTASDARYLLSRRFDEIVLVAKSVPVLEELTTGLADAWPTLTLGIGRVVTSVPEVRTSHRDAQIAVRHLMVQTGKMAISFDDLDVVTQLLAEVPVQRFAATAGPIVALLSENPIQLEALRAYFAMNRDVKAAADSIFLHPNTLRYRLERLEQALGRSLREPAVTASLYCVLTLMPDLAPASAAVAPDPISSGDDGEFHRAQAEAG
jgi:hypothetical protein